MKKRITTVLLTVALLVTGCSASKVYDNEEMLIKDSDTYSKTMYSQNSFQDGNEEKINIKCGSMEGMYTIWTCTTKEEEELSMTYDFQVTNGTAKLILIQSDDTVITLAEKSSQETDTSSETPENNTETCTLPLKPGQNRIKIVCKDKAKFTIELTISD